MEEELDIEWYVCGYHIYIEVWEPGVMQGRATMWMWAQEHNDRNALGVITMVSSHCSEWLFL